MEEEWGSWGDRPNSVRGHKAVDQKAASADASSSAKAAVTVTPPVTNPKMQQQTSASRSDSGSSPASLLRKAPTKKASVTRLATQTPAATSAAAYSTDPAVTAQTASNTSAAGTSSFMKVPSQQASDPLPRTAYQPKAALSVASSAEAATAATRQTAPPLPSTSSPAAALHSLPAKLKPPAARHTSTPLPPSNGQLTTDASQSSSPLADDWQSFLGSPTVGGNPSPTVGGNPRAPSASQRRTHSSHRQRPSDSIAAQIPLAKTSAGAPLTDAKTPPGPPSAAVNTPQAGLPAAARTPQAAPSTSTPNAAPAVQPPAPGLLAKAPSTSQAADSSITQSATEASSTSAQAPPSSQAPAPSLQDSAASAGKRPLLRPTAKLSAKELASTGSHAKQASTATGAASFAASDELRLTGNATPGTSSRAATSNVVSPHGQGTEQALPQASAKPGAPAPPHTANVSQPAVSLITTEPASPSNPDHKLYRPAGSSPSSSPASASARQASTASRAAGRASTPLAAPPAALQLPSSAPAVSSASSSVSAAAAAAAVGVGDAVRPKADRPKSAYTSSASVPTVRGPSISAAAADDIVDDDAAAAEGSGGHSQAQRPTLPGSRTAKPHAKLNPTPTPSAVPGVAFLSTAPIPFTVLGTTPVSPEAEEDIDDFFAGVEADLGSVSSRGTNVAHAGKAAGGHSHSQHRPQQVSASQPPKQLATLPAQATPHVPAKTAMGIPTAVASGPAAAPTVPLATYSTASSAASSAAASLATHPAAGFPGRSSSSRTKAFAAKPTAVEALATAELSEPALAQAQQPPAGAQQPVAADVDGASGVAEVQSAFVPIPFGGSAAAALHTGAGTMFGSQSDADQDDLDDSFFDSISAAGVAPSQHDASTIATSLQRPSSSAAPGLTASTNASSKPPSVLLPSPAKSASDASHDHQNGSQMSQELPSFHDWGDPSHAPSAASPPAATAEGPAAVPAVPAAAAAQEAAALSHQAPSLLSHTTSARPNIPAQPSDALRPAQLPMQLQSCEVWSEEAGWQLGGDGQEQNVPAASGVLGTSKPVGVAEASYGADTGREEQGVATQQPLFSIPFSGPSDPFAEEEDDIFGAVAGHQPGLLGAPGDSVGTEPSFAFDDLSAQQDELQSHPTAHITPDQLNTAVQGVSTGLYDANLYAQQQAGVQGPGWQNSMAEPAQQQPAGIGQDEPRSEAGTRQAQGQLPDQAIALWPQQHAQPSASLHAGSQFPFNPQLHTQSQLHPQPIQAESLQSQSHMLFRPHMQSQSQLPFQSQMQSQARPGMQSQLQSQSQSQMQPPTHSMFPPQSHLQSQVRPPVQPTWPASLSHGQQQHMAPQVFRPPVGVSQGLSSAAFSHFPSAAAAPCRPAPLPQSAAPLQPFQPAFQEPTSSQSTMAPLPAQPAFQPSMPGPHAHSQPAFQLPGGPLAVSTQRVSSPYAIDSIQHSQQEVCEEDFWASQDDGSALAESAGQVADAASAVQASEVSQEYDPWAGQHVPSQGYSPHLGALDQTTHDTAPLHPGRPHQHFPAAAVDSPAASGAAAQAAAAFPVTMSSPFAQAGYPAAFDPWAPNPHHPPSSQPLYPDSGIPPVPFTSSRQQNPWGAAHPWDLGAAAANPWDSSRGEGTPAAVLSEDNGGLDSGYRSSEGRPAVALLAFGFAGKVYCWQPTASPGLMGTASGFQSGSAGSLRILCWPRPHPDPTHPPPQQQQRPQLQQLQAPQLAADYELLHRFPGPLMPNTPKDRVLKFVSEACSTCTQTEPHSREPNELQLLWKLLLLLCQHKGDLHSAVTPGVSETRPEAQLLAILAPPPPQQHPQHAPGDPWSAASPMNAFSTTDVSSRVLQPQPGSEEMQRTAAHVQQLLMAGHRLEALRVAIAGKLWGPALLLAHSCGDTAFTETAAAMTEGNTTAGTPLHTLALLMSGKPDAVHAEPAAASASEQSSSPFAQAVQSRSAALLSQWQGNLAIMAANRVAGDEAAMVKLGDRIWRERSQAMAAHVCCVLAGLHSQSYDAASQLCLVGGDHRAHPRCFATLSAMQRNELLEWARSQGNSSYTLQHALALLPYKLLYACQLAQQGLISEAAQYCGAIQQAMGAVPKLPPGLSVCATCTKDLLDRLHSYAAAHNIPLQTSRSGSILSISGVGRWLDRGLSKLMGGPEVPPPSGPGSTGSTQSSDFDAYAARHKHRRNTSDQHLESETPRVLTPKRSQSSQDMQHLQQRPSRPTPSLASTPEKPSSSPQLDTDNGQEGSSRRDQAASNGQPQKAGGLGLLGRVASGLLSSGSRKGSSEKKATEAKLGEDNGFYYDNELKMWREKGKDAPAPSGPPPPPPKLSPQRTPSGSLSGMTRQASSGPPSSSGRPPLPAGPQPGPASVGQPTGNRAAVRSRYVSSFNSGSNATADAAAATVPIVPPKPLGAARAGGKSAKLFQPLAPAAATTDAQATSSAESSGAVDGSASSANCEAAAAVPTMFAASHTARSSAGNGRLSNPYADVSGKRMQANAAQHSTAQPHTGVSSGQQQQATGLTSVGASMMPAKQDVNAGAVQQVAAAQSGTDSTHDLVTTYSSFNHDPVYPYAAFGAAPAVAYADCDHLTDHFGSDIATTIAEVHAESRRGTTHVSSSFDDMTELQL